jgi:hypothetical protein
MRSFNSDKMQLRDRLANNQGMQPMVAQVNMGGGFQTTPFMDPQANFGGQNLDRGSQMWANGGSLDDK